MILIILGTICLLILKGNVSEPLKSKMQSTNCETFWDFQVSKFKSMYIFKNPYSSLKKKQTLKLCIQNQKLHLVGQS